MKKNLIFILLLILGISFGSTLFAQVDVTIGDGTQTNTTTGAPAPYGTWYKAFRQQFLVHASELNNQGGGPGNISALAFNVDILNNITPMNNFRIRLKHTTQTGLNTSFETGDYQQVFQANEFTPTTGWNVHTFSAPFNWDGASNLLVDIVTDVIAGAYAQNASAFYTATSFVSSLRFQNDSENGDTGTTGSTLNNRSNMRFTMQQLDMQDMSALTISGDITPSVNVLSNYTVRVKNLSPTSQSNYTVKLMAAPDTELASVNGTALASMQEQEFTLPWTPTDAGPMQLFGRVEMTGDENPNNNNTPILNVSVQPEGIQTVTIGEGNEDARIPMNFYWKSSIYQCIFLDSELNFPSGTITGLQWYNNFVTNNPNGATKIWLGNTAMADLSAGPISGSNMTLVFDGNVTFPAGENEILIPFTTPFPRTPGNIVMMVQRPLDGSYYDYDNYFKCQTIGSNRARMEYSDSTDYDPMNPPAGTLSGQFPKTTLFYSPESIDHDLGALTISGNTTPNVGSSIPYTITIKNNGQNTETNYTVKLMQQGGGELASVAGPAIESMQTLPVVLNWTPTAIGNVVVYGQVVMTTDEIASNNTTHTLSVDVQSADAVVVQLGVGTQVNGDTGSPAPYGTWYKAFREQYLYRADEIYAAGGAPGLITSLAFNVQSVGQCTPMTNFRIRLKHTQQTALVSSFEAGDYETVFQADDFLPVNGWNVHTLSEPFFWNGADNLIVEAVTDVCAGAYARNALVYFSSPGFNSSVRYQSDSVNGDTGTSGTVNANRSNIRLFLTVDDMGSMSGTVTTAGAALAGATVSVENTVFSTITAADGSYSLPFVNVGAQTVTASKHGYAPVSHNVTIVEDQNTVQDFALNLLPQVTVSGRIVGSDAPTVGIADATIALSGYEPYTATTNAQGQFTITNVFASQTYNYVASALGYAAAAGTVVVGTTNVNMGDIIVNEVAYPPHSVIANESTDFQSMNLSWESPVPGGVSFEDDFESYDNFVLEFGDWTLIDVDQSTTYGFSGVSFPHSGEAMSFIIFNTNATSPAIEGHPAHSGERVAACFASQTAVNNDWMITPQVLGGGEVRFWARTYMDYGLERFKLGVSTTGTNPADFTIISGASYVQVPLEWTEYVYDLSSYAGQQIHVGLNCVSDDCFILFVDDFYVGPTQLRTANDAVANANTNVSATRYPAIERAIVDHSAFTYKQATPPAPKNTQRSLIGYKVYRLLAADQQNEANWTTLTTNNITPTNYTDSSWGPLPSGVYRYAVKAVYTNNVLSNAAFSGEIHKGMMGILTGTVTEFGTNIPLEGATVTAGIYSGTTNAQGVYSFSVYAGNYNVTATKVGYQSSTQPGVIIVGTQTTTQNFVLTEITLPPAAVQAEEAGNNVNITWMAPGTAGGEWLSYCGDQDDAIGTGGATDFDIAIRFPASALVDYAGMSLHALKVYPHEANCSYSVRVWTGGSPTAPGELVVDQPFTHQADALNTVMLDNPVTITGDGELWFGMRCNTQTGFPAGCDAGPADNGFGNMMYFQGEWDTLIGLADLNYNWVIEGYAGYSAPDTRGELVKLGIDSKAEIIDPNRAHEGYRVWRLLQGQESNEGAWTSLTTNPISATAFQDTGWNNVADGMYKWAVKAIYTGGAMSATAFSNTVEKATQVGTIAGFVRNMQNQPINGATVSVDNKTGTTNASGAYTIPGVHQGTHSATASHPNYSAVTINNVVVVTGQTTTVNFQLPPSEILLEDSFESYPDFALSFDPWVLVDLDQSTTYGFSGITFPNSGSAMAYIIFNPSATTPVLESVAPHTGAKMAACFAAQSGPNDDWLITPIVAGGGQLRFWARTYMDYGLERFNIGVSNGGTAPSNFTIISGASPVEVPLEWTEYVYELSAYAGQDIRVGIQCVSDDVFIFLVDDVKITGPVSNEDVVAPVYTTALLGNYPNPFNPETTISYSLKESAPVSIEIYNVKGQKVRTLVNSVQDAGAHTAVWNGLDNNGKAASSGIYYFKMNAGKYSSTKKMIMMK